MNPPIRILLVDDHPMVREGLVARLQAVPRFEVVGEAGNRGEALAELARTSPDVVLMDVGLKDVNGIALGAEMLAAQPAIKLLMFSMYDNPEYVQQAMQAGARGYSTSICRNPPSSCRVPIPIGLVRESRPLLVRRHPFRPRLSGRLHGAGGT